MILPNRPILLITLPSLALLLGFVWLRRKKSFCDTGGDKKDKKTATTKSKSSAEQISCTSLLNYLNHSESLPITQSNINQASNLNSNQKGQKSGTSSGSSSANSSFENKLGKSAPIDIAPNPRSPPKRVTEQQVDHEILKLKIQEADYKNLLSIQELEDFEAESTPADSPFYRNKFDLSLKHEPKVEPVIIRATMAAKISPENSFAESKYTNIESGDDEPRDSANPSPSPAVGDDKASGAVEQSNDGAVKQQNQESTEGAGVGTSTEIIVDENQSPTRNPIASPPLSLCSVHSGDSGKGSSPPNSIGAPSLSYDFLIPQTLIGILIGRKGQFVNNIKTKTGANVTVKKNPHSKKSKICTIDGTQAEIDAALKMIRTKLPEKKFPYLTLDRIAPTPESTIVPTFDPSVLHLHLIEGINNDVTISTIISGGHVFLQQPLHPSYPSLNVLQQYMNQTYSMSEAPPLPNIIKDSICVVSVQNNWYRVQIVSHNPQTQSCLVKYLDFGGYISVLANELRQIRTDFMTVPFQAMECLLSNLRPKGDEWSKEAADTLLSLTNGVILQAQVVDYTPDNIPEVYLFRSIAKDNVIFINQEIVARDLAVWEENVQEAES